MSFAVYILASRPNGTLYVGMTDTLGPRVWEHREKLRQGFTSRYGVDRLVWYEAHDTREGAFRRERRIKDWNRAWKIRLIEELNPRWIDLYETLNGGIEDGVAPLLLSSLPTRPGEGSEPSKG